MLNYKPRDQIFLLKSVKKGNEVLLFLKEKENVLNALVKANKVLVHYCSRMKIDYTIAYENSFLSIYVKDYLILAISFNELKNKTCQQYNDLLNLVESYTFTDLNLIAECNPTIMENRKNIIPIKEAYDTISMDGFNEYIGRVGRQKFHIFPPVHNYRVHTTHRKYLINDIFCCSPGILIQDINNEFPSLCIILETDEFLKAYFLDNSKWNTSNIIYHYDKIKDKVIERTCHINMEDDIENKNVNFLLDLFNDNRSQILYVREKVNTKPFYIN